MIPSPRPRLAVAYGHRSLNAISLRTAARGWCDLIWLVEGTDPSVAATRPLLERFGTVVDVAGLSAADAAARLAAERPQGLATFYDTGMERLAEIAAAAGLPFHAPAVARALEDKLHQRRALADAGLPTPRAAALPEGIDAAQALALAQASGVTFPAMLKPRRASGSWHTFKVADAAELTARWTGLADEPPEERVLEEFLPDGPPMPGGFEEDYVSVETIFVAGSPVHLATTGRMPLAAPFRETGFFIPSTLTGETLSAVLTCAGETLAGLGVHHGTMHTEVKLTADGPRAIEVNGRIGGGVPEMLRIATGIDLIALTMRAALGEPIEVAAMPAPDRVGYRFFYQPPAEATRLVALDGLEALGDRPGVEDVYLHHPPGTALDARHGTRTYLFALVGSAQDHRGVTAMDEWLRREITATYE